ncbi:MAG: YbaN family protein [Bacteroidetes bacterium]|nr:YbaN family protein [Bacteroidota bacterium]
MKPLLCVLGVIFTGLGILGIFLPLLPTTPFLLLAAACFARGSEKFYNKLLNNKYLGQYITDFREKRGIPLRVKIISVTLLWLTIGYSALFAVKILWVKILLFVIATGVTIHILSIRTKSKEQRQ